MNDETFDRLMEMGFSPTHCQLASQFGCVTLEEAVNHIINPSFPGNNQAPVLNLKKMVPSEIQTDEKTDENRDLQIHSRCSASRDAYKVIADKKLATLKEETLKAKQLKRIEHDSIVKEVQADKRARQELQGHASNSEVNSATLPSENDGCDIIKSRINRNLEEEKEWNRKLEQKAKHDLQQSQKLKEEARKKVLLDIEQDRLKRAKIPAGNAQETSKTSVPMKDPEETPKKDLVTAADFALLRFRFPDGSQVTEKFKLTCKFSVVAHFVSVKLDSTDFSVAESFPPFKCYDASEHDKSLKELQIAGSVSLVVKRSASQQPGEIDEVPVINNVPNENTDDGSSDENDEIPYEPLIEEPVGPDLNVERVDDIQNDGAEELEAEEDFEVDAEMAAIEQGDENEDGRYGQRFRREGITFSIAQRLGGDGASRSGALEENQNLTVEALRLQRCQALMNRHSAVPTSRHIAETLKYNCASLKSMAAESVLHYSKNQKLFISNLDCVTAICLIEMLKKKNDLNSKTFRPFISSSIGELDLSGYRFLTNDLISVISLSKIYKLNLKFGDNLTDAALGLISNMKQLQSLDISFCSKFSGNAICKLFLKLPNLEIFRAAATKLSSASMESIFSCSSSFPKMNIMDLSETAVSNVENIIVSFPNLRHLYLNGIVLELFRNLSSLKDLRALYIANCSVSLDCLTAVAELKMLKALDLTNSVLTDVDTEKYSKFLASMTLMSIFKPPKHPPLQDESLQLVGELNLHEIDFSSCLGISSAGFESYFTILLSSKQPKMSIFLASNTHLSAGATTFLSSLKNLVELNLDYTEIGDEGVMNIQGLPLLSSLSVVGNNLSDKIFAGTNVDSTSVLSKLFTTLTSLSKLNLSRNENISNFGLKRLRVVTLETLAVVQTKVTNAIEDVLKTNMYNLRVIRW